MRLLPAFLLMTLLASPVAAQQGPSAAPQQVEIPSGNAVLHAQLYKPAGGGPTITRSATLVLKPATRVLSAHQMCLKRRKKDPKIRCPAHVAWTATASIDGT